MTVNNSPSLQRLTVVENGQNRKVETGPEDHLGCCQMSLDHVQLSTCFSLLRLENAHRDRLRTPRLLPPLPSARGSLAPCSQAKVKTKTASGEILKVVGLTSLTTLITLFHPEWVPRYYNSCRSMPS